MKTDTEFMAVKELLGLRKKNMMFENAEYQRGKVWTRVQQHVAGWHDGSHLADRR